jgi:hypothetical protein
MNCRAPAGTKERTLRRPLIGFQQLLRWLIVDGLQRFQLAQDGAVALEIHIAFQLTELRQIEQRRQVGDRRFAEIQGLQGHSPKRFQVLDARPQHLQALQGQTAQGRQVMDPRDINVQTFEKGHILERRQVRHLRGTTSQEGQR